MSKIRLAIVAVLTAATAGLPLGPALVPAARLHTNPPATQIVADDGGKVGPTGG